MRGWYSQSMGRQKNRGPKELSSLETGTIIKDWGGRLPVALVYPNSYYLGMSNLGVHAIYRLLNRYPDVVCERVFWEKDQKEPPKAVESGRPLADFAVVAFSITYELDYLNVPRILEAGGLPTRAAARDEAYPVIIAGGACITANPLPVAPFFDCLGIGEAEAILPAMLPALRQGAGSRPGLLAELAKLPGLYVPGYSTGPVARQWLRDLDGYPTHTTVLTPGTELGNLYLIEVERGCPYACRFCLVRGAFRPARYRSVDSILQQAEAGLRHRRRIGLVGPAVTTHPQVETLVEGLAGMGAGLSVSSLRVRPLPEAVLGAVLRGGARTVALAPEAGSERLRRLINKAVSREDVLEATRKVAGHGARHLKLYFMFGLPTETDEDIEAIVRLSLDCKAVLDSRRAGGRLSLTLAPFVPKAGTPFQWHGMAPLPVLERRLRFLRGQLQPRGISLGGESLAWSQVQATLARGDERLASVLEDPAAGTLAGWRRAMKSAGLDTEASATARLDPAAPLPWAFIDTGTDTAHLRREMKRAMA